MYAQRSFTWPFAAQRCTAIQIIVIIIIIIITMNIYTCIHIHMLCIYIYNIYLSIYLYLYLYIYICIYIRRCLTPCRGNGRTGLERVPPWHRPYYLSYGNKHSGVRHGERPRPRDQRKRSYWGPCVSHTGVCDKKHSSGEEDLGRMAFRAPN